jgi:dolichyl-diphosphooligosaccharide--protein glycosyltransferase
VTVDIDSVSRTQVLYLSALFLLVGSIAFVQIPVKQSQLTISEDQYETATWIEEYSEQTRLAYPDTRVFSYSGRTRFYNYVVNGESNTFTYEQENYPEFLQSSEPESWYKELHSRAGFVVIGHQYRDSVAYRPDSMMRRLYENHGSSYDDVDAVSHYRLVHVSDDRSIKTYELVPGANIYGETAPNRTVTVSQDREAPVPFEYRHRTTSNRTGEFTVSVPYTGVYDVDGQTVRVSEADIQNGTTVSVDDRG